MSEEHAKSHYLASNFVDQTSFQEVSIQKEVTSVESKTKNSSENEYLRVQKLREELASILEQKSLLEEQIKSFQSNTEV